MISLQASIYGQAQYVIVWLGPPTEDSHIALDALFQLKYDFEFWPQKDTHSILEALKPNTNDPNAAAFLGSIFDRLSANGSKQFQAIVAFFHRPWFHRAWVVQEVAMADNARMITIMFGDGICPWETLNKAAIMLFQVLCLQEHVSLYDAQVQLLLSQLRQHLGSIFLEIDERRRDRSKSFGHLLEAWLWHGTREATKPQDLLYSLLGMASDGQTCGFDIDYRRDYDQVFAQGAVVLLKSAGADTLAWRSFQRRMDRTNPFIPSWVSEYVASEVDSRLPSWVPDFRVKRRPAKLLGSRHSLFQASGNHIFTFSVDDKLKTLSLNGAFVDEIAKTYDIDQAALEYVAKLQGSPRKGTSFTSQWLQAFKAIVQASATIHPQFTERYSEQDIQEIIWRVPVGDRTASDHGGLRRATEETAALHAVASASQDPSEPEVTEDSGARSRIYEECIYILNKLAFITNSGYLGVASQDVLEGDRVFVIQGSEVPFVLRQIDDSHYKNLGEAYVHGIMDGELLAKEYEFQDLNIL